MGSQVSGILEANDFSEFADRIQFMGAVARSDADLGATAEAAAQRAEWAADVHRSAVADAESFVAVSADRRERIAQMLDEQERIAAELEGEYEEYQAYLAAQRAALEAAAQQEAPGAETQPPSGSGGGGGWTPPTNSGGAAVAVSAARSVIGTQYVAGGASPGGFDCSGLTSWAWAQAGVSLPHSASAQYGSLPRVPLSAVQPGDIIYCGNFGPHTALYAGGGQIIHTTSPGPGGQVRIESMYGYDRPWGAVRPG